MQCTVAGLIRNISKAQHACVALHKEQADMSWQNDTIFVVPQTPAERYCTRRYGCCQQLRHDDQEMRVTYVWLRLLLLLVLLNPFIMIDVMRCDMKRYFWWLAINAAKWHRLMCTAELDAITKTDLLLCWL